MSTKTLSASKPRPNKASSSSTPVAEVHHLHGGIAPKSFHEPAERQDALVPEASVQLYRLDRLRRAPENVRHTGADEDVAELAEDIAAHGLLQSLIGYQEPSKSGLGTIAYVVGGGRRLQALNLLCERGAIDGSYEVPILIRAKEEAVELSLSENLARRDMSPADEFEAFAALMKPGTLSPLDLAKRFGFTERYVQQRLRLAALAPEILDAVRTRKVSLDGAVAYAKSSDVDLQRQVFAQQERAGHDNHAPHKIRQGYEAAYQNTNSALFTFVGADAYEAAGGGYEDDLFGGLGQMGGRRLTHGVLLAQIGQEKAEAAVAGLLSEAKKSRPHIASALVPAGVRAGGYPANWPKAPKGYAFVETRYGATEKLWAAAAAADATIIAIVGIDSEGVLKLHDRAFFVPKDRLEMVVGPKEEPVDYEAARVEREERAKVERRANGIRILAAKMAIDANAEAKVDGRRFWSPNLYFNSMSHPALGQGLTLSQSVFVTPEEIEAKMAAAEADYDASVARDAEAAEEKRKAEEEAERAEEQRRTDIKAMDPQPAVIVADMMAFFRWADGSYRDVREGSGDEVVDDFSADCLEDLLDGSEVITRVCTTLEEYDCAVVAEARREDGE